MFGPQACRRVFCCAALLTMLVVLPAAAAPRPFQYVSPLPGARRVPARHGIAIRPGAPLDPTSAIAGRLHASGSLSGEHAGGLRLSADGRTLRFDPVVPWAAGETVHVSLAPGLRTLAGEELPGLAFDFVVSHAATLPPSRDPRLPSPFAAVRALAPAAVTRTADAGPCDTVLANVPPTTIAASGTLPREAWFEAPWSLNDFVHASLEILDDLGQPLYLRSFPGDWLPADFKVQPDGRLSFWLNEADKFYWMNSTYTIVDSLESVDGYHPDLHEMQALPNGHLLFMCLDPQPVGMDTVVAGGDPNATVIGVVLLELDETRTPVFEWRSWDHFAITDGAASPLSTLTGPTVDYVHCNSISVGPDGNLVISCRHMDELTKIDRETGDIIWRMGLHAINNQFTFPNDDRGFSHQHDARVLANGHITLFDNGNYLDPLYSRALEFAVDEASHVATKVWEYRHDPDVYASFMGSVQRHDDGSTTIGWGGTFGEPKATELDADGHQVADLTMSLEQVDYRTFRFPWRTSRIATDALGLDFGVSTVGETPNRTFTVINHWAQPLELTCLRTTRPEFVASPVTGGLPRTLAPGESLLVRVDFSPAAPDTVTARLYIEQVSDLEFVAQSIDLLGVVGDAAGVTSTGEVALALDPAPNPTHGTATIRFGLPATGRVQLDVFDVRGRRVAALADGVRPAGRQQVAWAADGRAAGLYWVRLRAAGRTLVRKVVVTR